MVNYAQELAIWRESFAEWHRHRTDETAKVEQELRMYFVKNCKQSAVRRKKSPTLTTVQIKSNDQH